MNQDAGRGDLLIISLHLESGEELPFLVDTGSPITILDRSLEPKLGRCLGTATLRNFGTEYEANKYATPRLYLGDTPLLTGSSVLACDDAKKIASAARHPLMGTLGMDCLQHYCLQLDFQARKIRFLDSAHVQPAQLGQAFPLTFSSARPGSTEWVYPFIHHASLIGVDDAMIDTGANVDGCLKPELFLRAVREQRRRENEDAPRDREPNTICLPQWVWNGVTYIDLWMGNGAGWTERAGGLNSLGLRFLARHLVTFDFPHRTMYLKRITRLPLLDDEVDAAADAAGHSALPVVRKLMRSGQLPGWSKKDRGTINDIFSYLPQRDSVTFDAQKRGDSSTYHYQFARASKDSPWQLQEAWRTDQDDHVIEEYPVP